MSRRRYGLIYRYAGREYLLSLLVAFTFFFFIFFINQILLIAQHIMVKNVSLKIVLRLVSFAIPQFLLYTFPFSSLTAAAMTIGQLSSTNEILALRFSGINLKRVFYPIILLAALIALFTFYTADYLLPGSSRMYKDLYADLMRDLPTLDLESWKSNRIGDLVISNGKVEGDRIENLVLYHTRDGRVITSPEARIFLDDPVHFVYRLDLTDPRVLDKQQNQWSCADAEDATVYLDFSSRVPTSDNQSPSHLSIAELDIKIEALDGELERMWSEYETRRYEAESFLASSDARSYNKNMATLQETESDKPMLFYLQYYRAEKQRKFALAAACIILALMSFPLAYLPLKHGKLIGFALAMLFSVLYWYLLFFAQISIFDTPLHPLFLIWLPDLILLAVALIALWRVRK